MASTKSTERPCASCQGEANLSCKACKLVLYCSAECQKEHWSKHRIDCKSPLMKSNWKPGWVVEGRTPTFIGNGRPLVSFGGKKFFWGNVPAYDILNLPANEGEHYEKELRVLFAASGDPRNVFETLASLPTGYDGQVAVHINDRDFDIVARNIILVLTALVAEDDNQAIECMIHLWYSAMIRPSDANILTTTVRPLIEDVVRKVASKPDNQWLGKTWTIGANTCRVELPKRSWERLLAYFDVPAGLTAEQANKIRKDVTLAPERVDYRERHMLMQLPTHRIGLTKFREDGIFLPFGSSRKAFTVPNPTMFQSANWPMKDSADRLEGWHYPTILNVDAGPASNDLYGKLFCHLRELLGALRHRLSSQGCNFHFLNVDATDLPKYLVRKEFARIETSNIADGGYLGTARTVVALSPLLQSQADNPCATLITLYMNAVEEICQLDPVSSRKDIFKVMQYMDRPNSMPTSRYDPLMIVALECLDNVRDGDKHFNQYMASQHFHDIAAACEMAMKDRNTIIEKWPLQLKKKPGQPGAKEEFELLSSSPHMGSERYVEWKRV